MNYFIADHNVTDELIPLTESAFELLASSLQATFVKSEWETTYTACEGEGNPHFLVLRRK